jgi:hypothetical protein
MDRLDVAVCSLFAENTKKLTSVASYLIKVEVIVLIIQDLTHFQHSDGHKRNNFRCYSFKLLFLFSKEKQAYDTIMSV